MNENRELPDGVKLVKSDTFWPEGRFYFVRDLATPLVWIPKAGWRKYYEAIRADSHFQDEEAAMRAWNQAHRE